MAKLSKKIRKRARGVVASPFVQGILRDLIKAALIAAAGRLVESRTAGKAMRKVKRAIKAETGKPQRKARRKAGSSH